MRLCRSISLANFTRFCLLSCLLLGDQSIGWGQDAPSKKSESKKSEQQSKEAETEGKSEKPDEAKPAELKGGDDLDKAFDLKIKAQSTRDLDAVAKLCKSAIEKGLDDESKLQAQQLAASALYEFADQLAQRIFTPPQDDRWQQYRTQALTRLNRAVEYQPDMTAAYVLIARLNLELPNGDRKAATAAVEKAVEYAGEDREQLSSALLMRATLATEPDAQLSDLNQAVKINPRNISALRVRVMLHAVQDHKEDTLADLKTLIESPAITAIEYVGIIGQLSQLGPKFTEEMRSKAIEMMDKAIRMEEKLLIAYSMRAELRIMDEQYDEAITDFTAAIKLDQENPKSRRNYELLSRRAALYLDQEKPELAMKDLETILERDSGNAGAIYLRGLAEMQLDNYKSAIADIKLLADSTPDNDGYQRQLAMLYNAADEPEKAIKIYDRLIERYAPEKFKNRPDIVQYAAMEQRANNLRGRGDAYLSTGEHAKAVQDFALALSLTEELRALSEQETDEKIPADDGILNNYAWVLATSPDDEVRDGKKAIELATAAAEATDYKQAHILSTLASGYAEAGDFKNAIKWIKKAIEVNREEQAKNPSKRNTEQSESLQKEFESYEQKKPWREDQGQELKAKRTKKSSDEQADNDSESSEDTKNPDSKEAKKDDPNMKDSDKQESEKKESEKKDSDK